MKQQLNERERKVFVEMPEISSVLTLAVPTVLSQIISVIYNLADTYYIGRTDNPDMVAAASVCMTLLLLMTGMANLFGIGGSSLIARCLGSQDFKKARQTSAFSVWGGVTFVLVYSALLFLFSDTFLSLLGAGRGTLDYCYTYMFWTCIVGGLPTVMNPLLAHLVRSEGASREASLGVSMGGILNIALDPLFMFVILPKGCEVAGAAIATMLSNLSATVFFIIYIIRHRKTSVLSMDPRDLSFGNQIPGDVISIGLPSFLMTMLSSFSNAVVNNLISGESSAAVAGMGIAKKINMLSFRVSTGITQGALPLIAYNHTAGDFKRMKKSILSAAELAVGFASVCMCISFLFGGIFVGFFINDAETVRFGRYFVKTICLAMPLAAATMTFMMLFQATARKAKATFISMLRKGILDVPLMFALNRIWPLYGVARATPIAELAACTIAVTTAFRFLKSLKAGDSPLTGSAESR